MSERRTRIANYWLVLPVVAAVAFILGYGHGYLDGRQRGFRNGIDATVCFAEQLGDRRDLEFCERYARQRGGGA